MGMWARASGRVNESTRALGRRGGTSWAGYVRLGEAAGTRGRIVTHRTQWHLHNFE